MGTKKHKRKAGYTIMIVSDSVEKSPKKIHIDMGRLSLAAFMLLLVVVCYAEYTTILMHGATVRSESYAEQIAALQKDNESLLSEKEGLEKQIANLNQTLTQVEAQASKQEKTSQAAAEEEKMPKGFPVSGAAQIKETGEGAAAGIQAQQEWKEVIFVVPSGEKVISTGEGKVVGVLPAKDGEPGGISIDHGNGYISNYRNVGEAKVETGSQVKQGTVLFEIGENNAEIGYSISKDENFLEPMEIIEIKG